MFWCAAACGAARGVRRAARAEPVALRQPRKYNAFWYGYYTAKIENVQCYNSANYIRIVANRLIEDWHSEGVISAHEDPVTNTTSGHVDAIVPSQFIMQK